MQFLPQHPPLSVYGHRDQKTPVARVYDMIIHNSSQNLEEPEGLLFVLDESSQRSSPQ